MADRYPIVVINGELKELPSGDTIPAAVVPSTFLGLTDTPSAYTSQALKAVRVNAGESALEFYTPSSGITIGSTAITSGTNDRILYQSGGVVSQSANFVYDGAGHVGIQSTPDSNYGLAIGGIFAGLTISGISAADFILYHSGSATNAKRSFFRHQSGVGTISTLNDGLGYQVQGVLTWDALTGKVAIGLGATAPSNGQLEVRSTTEQLRLSYDASNYSSTTVGPTGGVTFDAVGSGAKFVFSDAVEINGSLTLSAQNIVTDTTTGMKIGTGTTQKLGFFNATPVTQRANIGQLTDLTGGTIVTTLQDCDGGGGVADVATINDNFAGVLTKINKLEAALKDLGFAA